MSSVPAKVINELFVSKLDNAEEREKVASEGAAFIRTKLREVSFSRKILRPEFVTKADLQNSVNHDGLVKIVDIEPDSKAMAINFRGQADAHYIQGSRYEIPFFMISSEDFQKAEEELMAYEMPITEIIERNAVKDIQAVEDQAFINHVEAALIAQNPTDPTKRKVVTGPTGRLSKQHFVDLFNALEGGVSGGNNDYLKTDVILMSNKDYNDLLLWEANSVGDALGQEIVVNGYTFPTLFGKKLIVTGKQDLVPEGTMYAFASKEYLGDAFLLNDVKFWIDKRKNIITFSAYEVIGMGIGNINGIAKITWSKS